MRFNHHSNFENISSDKKWIKQEKGNLINWWSKGLFGPVYKQDPFTGVSWLRKIGPFDDALQKAVNEKCKAEKKGQQLNINRRKAEKTEDKALFETADKSYKNAYAEYQEWVTKCKELESRKKHEEEQSFLRTIEEDRQAQAKKRESDLRRKNITNATLNPSMPKTTHKINHTTTVKPGTVLTGDSSISKTTNECPKYSKDRCKECGKMYKKLLTRIKM